MIGRKGIVGLCLLCALAISAVAAQAASADLQAYKCQNTGTFTGVNRFSDAHCKTVSNPSGEYGHVALSEGSHPVSLTNTLTGEERSPGFLKATVAGFGVTLEAKKVSGTGTFENTGGHAAGSGETIKFEEVTANQKCTVTGIPGGVAKVETLPVKATTQGTGNALKFEPKEGTKFAEFELSGAECPAALKGKYPVVGTVSGVPNGATTAFSHAEVTAAKSLRLKSAEGPIAGLEGTITLSTEGTPIAST